MSFKSLSKFLWSPAAGAMDKQGKNPANAAMPWLTKAAESQDPYIKAGQDASNKLNPQYGDMAQNTNEYLNNIHSQYNASPEFAAKRDQLLGEARNTAAAGGFVGGEQHQKGATGLVNNLMNEDFQKWYNNYMGIQKTGQQGQAHTADQGFEATNNQANQYNNIGQAQYQSQDWKNRQQADRMNRLLKLIGATGGAIVGGPAGAAAGSQAGSNFF